MESEDLNNILTKLADSINEDLDEKVLRYANQYLSNQDDDEVLLCKVTSLIKLEKYSQALQIQKSMKIENQEQRFLKAYTHYRLKEFHECLKILNTCEKEVEAGTFNEAKIQILKSQVYNKQEDYAKSAEVLTNLLLKGFNQGEGMQEEGGDTAWLDGVLEDLCANFFNALSMLLWVNHNSGNQTILSEQRKKALDAAVDFCLNKPDQVTLREVFLNLCIALAVNAVCEGSLFTVEEEKEWSQAALDLFYQRLDEADDDGMQIDEDFDELDDRAKDRIIANILESIFQNRSKKVRIETEKLDRAMDAFELLDEADVVLKTSIISYVLYFRVGGEGGQDYFNIGKSIDSILKRLEGKNLKIADKLKQVITRKLTFNKAITLFLRGKHQDVKEFNLSTDKVENDLIRHFVLMKRKDFDKLEEIRGQLSGSQKDKILGLLMQVSVYYQLNNQEKFIELFKVLMNVSGEKLKKEERNTNQPSFSRFLSDTF